MIGDLEDLPGETRAEHSLRCSDCGTLDQNEIITPCHTCGTLACERCSDNRGCIPCEDAARHRMKQQWVVESVGLNRIIDDIEHCKVSSDDFAEIMYAIIERVIDAAQYEQ